MRVLNAVRRVLLLLVMIPVIAIVLDTLLQAFNARPRNPIVSTVHDFANIFIIDAFKTVFPEQGYVQNALVALAAFGVLALLIIFIFRGLRAMVGARPPRVRSGPAASGSKSSPAKTTKTTKTSEQTGPATSAGASAATSESGASSKSGVASTSDSNDDTKSSSA